MTTIAIYKQEIENELDKVREILEEFKGRIEDLSDVERIDTIQDVEELEKMASDIRAKVIKINDEMEYSWEQIKNDVDSSIDTIKEAFARLNRALV